MSKKYTCLFGGGAIRGLSYVGAVTAFEQLNIEYDILGGSSVGSILAAMLAVGYSAKECKEAFLHVNFNLFRDISIGIGQFFAVSKGEVFLEWIRELIERKFYGEAYKKGSNKAVTFSDIDGELVIIATNLSDFKCKEFSKAETPDFEIASAVRISCCMPGLMKPVEYNNMLLVDGDLQKSKPMWKLSQTINKSESRIMELRLEGYYEKNDISGIDYANAVYSCVTAVATDFVQELYSDNDRYECITLNTGEIIVVDFNINEDKRTELIQSGYNQIMDYFKFQLPQKKSKIRNCYFKIYSHISKIRKNILKQNILRAKNEFGELFMDLPACYDKIDKSDYNRLIKLKDIFIDSIKYPLILGLVKLTHRDLILKKLNLFTDYLAGKIQELSE